MVKSALKAIYKYNFKRSMRDFFNPCRVFSLNDEAGTIICSWPEKKQKPIIPIPYAEETMSGFEYAVGSHMIQEGLVDEGLEIVKAIRERYDGEKRNPWNEIECGSNYSRSMASYVLLLALSGFKFDMIKGEIGFNPLGVVDGKFSCFWSTGTGWGKFDMQLDKVAIAVYYGILKIKTLDLPFLINRKIKKITVENKTIECESFKGKINFNNTITIEKGQTLSILLD
jgi:hypothetical protein